MKNCKRLILFKITLLYVAITLMFFSCDTQNEQIMPLEPVTEQSKIEITKAPINLTGESVFSVYAVKGKSFVLEPGSFVTTGTLIHMKGQSYLLKTEVYLPMEDGSQMLFRKVDFDAKITPGGAVKMYWPSEWWEFGEVIQGPVLEQMMIHTGYVFHGPGVSKGTQLFNGKFDGKYLSVESSLNAKQVQEGTFPAYKEIVDGPIKMVIGFELHLN